MRLTVRTNLAMRALMACAVNPGQILRKSEIAEACNASENHLAQVVRALAQFGFIHAMRGRNGGIELARAPQDINVGELFRAFESEHPFAECFDGAENTCPLKDCCWLRPALVNALEAFYGSLDKVTLEDLISNNSQLAQVLEHHDPNERIPSRLMRMCHVAAAEAAAE